MILLASISRPGRIALSSEFQWSEHSLQASSPLTGKVHRYLALGPPSWPKKKAQNRIFPRNCVALARKVAGCLELKMAPPQKLSGSLHSLFKYMKFLKNVINLFLKYKKLVL